MSKSSSPALPRLTPEQRLAAAGQFERANQVLTTGNLEYGMQLLLNCCLIDPANPTYRQALRQAQKAKYKHNLIGQKMAVLMTLRAKLKLKTAQQRSEWVKVLECAEPVFMRNPWDLGTHLAMAEAFDELGVQGMAIWTLDQIRQVDGDNPKINRPLARLFEKTGNFTAATALWEKVRIAVPDDLEAQRKFKDLAASATIAKGRYEDALRGTAPTPLKGIPEDAERRARRRGRDSRAANARATDGNGYAAREPAATKAGSKFRVKSPPLSPRSRPIPPIPMATCTWRRFSAAPTSLTRPARSGAALGPTANSFEIAMELIDLEIEPFRRDLAIAEEKLSRQPVNPELQACAGDWPRKSPRVSWTIFAINPIAFPPRTPIAWKWACGSCAAGKSTKRSGNSRRFVPIAATRARPCLSRLLFSGRNNWRLAQRNFEEALGQLTPADEVRKEILYELAKGYAASGDLTRAIDMACELANIDFNYKDIGKLLDDWNANVEGVIISPLSYGKDRHAEIIVGAGGAVAFAGRSCAFAGG